MSSSPEEEQEGEDETEQEGTLVKLAKADWKCVDRLQRLCFGDLCWASENVSSALNGECVEWNGYLGERVGLGWCDPKEGDLAGVLIARIVDPIEIEQGEFCSLTRARHAMHVMLLAVHPHHRRKGIATKLLRLAEDLILEAQGSGLVLHVQEGNDAATDLYKREGFLFLGSIENYYPASSMWPSRSREANVYFKRTN